MCKGLQNRSKENEEIATGGGGQPDYAWCLGPEALKCSPNGSALRLRCSGALLACRELRSASYIFRVKRMMNSHRVSPQKLTEISILLFGAGGNQTWTQNHRLYFSTEQFCLGVCLEKAPSTAQRCLCEILLTLGRCSPKVLLGTL